MRNVLGAIRLLREKLTSPSHDIDDSLFTINLAGKTSVRCSFLFSAGGNCFCMLFYCYFTAFGIGSEVAVKWTCRGSSCLQGDEEGSFW